MHYIRAFFIEVAIITCIIPLVIWFTILHTRHKFDSKDLFFRQQVIEKKIESGIKSINISDIDYIDRYNRDVLLYRDLNYNDWLVDIVINDSALAILSYFEYDKNKQKWLRIK